MKIGIIGSGDVAKSLATGLLRHGHDVMLGSSDAAKRGAWAAENKGGKTGSFAEVAQFAELAILAVKGNAAVAAIELAGPSSLNGKVVIDATNPIADAPPVNGVLPLFTGPNESVMERLQTAFPAVRFVKAFNSVGFAHFIDPSFVGGRPTMFICGNDNLAKSSVAAILDQVGWDSADMGQVQSARLIEPLSALWCIPGFLRNEWGHAFKLVKSA